MGNAIKGLVWSIALCTSLCGPASATVQIVTMKAAQKSPQTIGTSITWNVQATDTNAGPIMFQFNVAAAGGPFQLARDFNVGTLSNGVWAPHQYFKWTPTGPEGTYQIQVVAKDFASGETSSQTVSYTVTPLATGSLPVVAPTANTLVALFSAPSCPAGSTMRVTFQEQSGGAPATMTNWANCDGIHTMTFEIAGMYPATTYSMLAQTQTGTDIENGSPVSFTSGTLPANLVFPKFRTIVRAGPRADTADSILLHSLVEGMNHPSVATDLAGNVMWYNNSTASVSLITRPLQNGTLLTFDTGAAWNPNATQAQLLRQVDLAGNILRETNTGILQQRLQALGAVDAQACDHIPTPPPVGAACMGAFSHDAIQTLPNGYTAVQAAIEKIFPPGTQGDTSGLPVDVVGDLIFVLDNNWQPVWYFDAFEHAGGAPELDINRSAILSDPCSPANGCPFVYLLSAGVSSTGADWTHGNSLYYWPKDGSILWSSRNQDWVLKIDYGNGTGTGKIVWRMGREGDFAFNNIYNDPWPWFSGQHEAGMENGGAGPFTVFDNGNSRVADRPIGLGLTCGNDCNSRGMVLDIDEVNMQVTPILSVGLGVYSIALGSAQLLDDGEYFFQPGQVRLGGVLFSYATEIVPTSKGSGTKVLDLRGPQSYRSWQMSSMYTPPAQ